MPSNHSPGLAAFLRCVVASNVTVHEAAVGAIPGTATLVTDDRPGRDALARLGQDTVEGIDPAHRVEREVEVIALDDLDLDDVGFVKIDVEGHELEALAGAERLLGAQRPTVVLEAEQRHIDHPISDVFAAVTDARLPRLVPVRPSLAPARSVRRHGHQRRWSTRRPPRPT